ncbi:hypothetical protein PR048_005761 [Dryococelus australis]|uniref:G-protein coupled receptors family 1 profile domain-containing protein n=1 Tax=Dryococelus australis TaxID=614101 RepID=A0ABQ9I940_9NEOP|nr:hypothetical protein PR048_005761 [Dryococelus australis]
MGHEFDPAVDCIRGNQSAAVTAGGARRLAADEVMCLLGEGSDGTGEPALVALLALDLVVLCLVVAVNSSVAAAMLRRRRTLFSACPASRSNKPPTRSANSLSTSANPSTSNQLPSTSAKLPSISANSPPHQPTPLHISQLPSSSDQLPSNLPTAPQSLPNTLHVCQLPFLHFNSPPCQPLHISTPSTSANSLPLSPLNSPFCHIPSDPLHVCQLPSSSDNFPLILQTTIQFCQISSMSANSPHVFQHPSTSANSPPVRQPFKVTLLLVEGSHRFQTVILLTSHQGEPGSIPGRGTSRFSQVGIVPDDVAGSRVSKESPVSPTPCIPALHHSHLISPSSALETSLFVLSLCVADLAVAGSTSYYKAFAYFCPVQKSLSRRRTACVARFAFMVLSFLASGQSLVLLALDRYCAVVHALRYKQIVNSRQPLVNNPYLANPQLPVRLQGVLVILLAPEFSHVGFVPNNAAVQEVFSGISRPSHPLFSFRRCSILTSLQTHRLLKVTQISSLTHSTVVSLLHQGRSLTAGESSPPKQFVSRRRVYQHSQTKNEMGLSAYFALVPTSTNISPMELTKRGDKHSSAGTQEVATVRLACAAYPIFPLRSHPQHFKPTFRRKDSLMRSLSLLRSCLMVAGVWLLAVAIAGVLFVWNHWTPQRPCEEQFVMPQSYVAVTASMSHCLVFGSVSVIHLKIYLLVSRQSQGRSPLRSPSAQVLILITSCYLVCWAPFLLVFAVRQCLTGYSELVECLFRATFTLTTLNYIFNTFIFSWKNKVVRAAVLDLFRCSHHLDDPLRPFTMSIRWTDSGENEVRMEQRRISKAGETRYPQENPPTSGIVRQNPNSKNPGVTWLGIEPGPS